MLYGAHIMGVSNSMFCHQRQAAAANSSAPGQGKQVETVLWLADAGGTRTDPAYAAHELPLGFLARAIWERWLPIEQIVEAIATAEESLRRGRVRLEFRYRPIHRRNRDIAKTSVG